VKREKQLSGATTRAGGRDLDKVHVMVTASQFVSPQFKELFSCFAHFLHFFERSVAHATTAFPAFFFPKKGEHCAKRPVHPLRPHRVHLTDLVNHSKIKMFAASHCRSWARRGRVVGWNDPTFSSLARPKRFLGSFPAHTRVRKVSAMQMSAISIP
jgi:hypothetical protein